MSIMCTWKIPWTRFGQGCLKRFFTRKWYYMEITMDLFDFAKAFDSVHRHSLWKLLRAYGIPFHLVEIIKSFYGNFTCCVGDGDILFEVHTGVRQGCVMSTFLFNLVVDWIMHRTTEDQVRGNQMDTFLLPGRPGLRRRSSLTITHPHPHTREDASPQHLCKASWPEHQQQED